MYNAEIPSAAVERVRWDRISEAAPEPEDNDKEDRATVRPSASLRTEQWSK